MPPRFLFRSSTRRARSWVVASLATMLALALAGTLPGAPAYAANPVTPGTYRGLGFDQCEAPSQSAMSTWIKKSPFRAAGIYISGNSRACRRQSNLSATWVRNQLSAGWHLMPITLGPQAACSTRYPRYGKSIDPTISSSTANTYSAARSQGRLEANRAVTAARDLGIVPGSTLFYDLEAFNTGHSTACTWSALWFVHSWTNQLHKLGYASGFYSSAASGIRMLDDARVRSGNPITMPDQVWIADWNGRADVKSSYIRSDGWMPYSRAHQYKGGHNETYGGVTINIDRNYLDLRAPRIPGGSSPAPAPAPTPTPAPAPTSGPTPTKGTADAACTGSSISKRSYLYTSAHTRTWYHTALQCLLKQRGLYNYKVTGDWNAQTAAGVRAYQHRVGQRVRSGLTRGNWVTLVTAGSTWSTQRLGSKGPDVTRVQRAMNAAGSPHLTVSGVYDTATANAVGAYQRKLGLRVTKAVDSATWKAMRRGRR